VEFNSYWYLGLAILSIFLLVYIIIKTRNIRHLLLFLSMVGLGYMIEAVIYNFLHCYQYYPKLIKHDPFYDSNMGAIASNALALPVVATFLAVFRKNWKWLIFFIILFAFIEWLFLELGIYSHNWWRTIYTSLGLPVYFTLAKVFYGKLSQPSKGFFHSILLFLIIGPISGTLHIFPIMFFSIRYYETGWFDHLSQDTTAFSAIFYLSASLLYVLLTKTKWPSWLKYLLTAFSIYTTTFTLKEVNILHSQVWWDTFYYVLLSITLMKLTIMFSKLLTNGPENKSQTH
jgi:hypothetical protein